MVVDDKSRKSRSFIEKKLAVKVTKDCRTTSDFITRLGFKQYDVILRKNNHC